MRQRTLATYIASLALLSAACASGADSGSHDAAPSQQSGTPTAAPSCAPLKPKALAVLKQGVRKGRDVNLDAGKVVALPKDLRWPLGDKAMMNVAAVQISDSAGRHEVVLFALEDPQANGGLILGINGALDWFNWGDMAAPGSPVDDYLQKVAHSDAAKDAHSCLAKALS